jgi:hypothetical protein
MIMAARLSDSICIKKDTERLEDATRDRKEEAVNLGGARRIYSRRNRDGISHQHAALHT